MMVKFANCPWPVCSDSRRCSQAGVCVADAQAKALPGRPLHCLTIGGCPKIEACAEVGKCALDPASYAKAALEAAAVIGAQLVALPPLMGHAEIEAEAERRRNFGSINATTGVCVNAEGCPDPKACIADGFCATTRSGAAVEIPSPIFSGIVGDADVPLNEDTDARRWATEFMQAKAFIESRGDKLDEGTMLSWFSNAIMCGIDSAQRRYARIVQSAKGDIDRIDQNAKALNDVAANAINRVHALENARKWWFLAGLISGIIVVLFEAWRIGSKMVP